MLKQYLNLAKSHIKSVVAITLLTLPVIYGISQSIYLNFISTKSKSDRDDKNLEFSSPSQTLYIFFSSQTGTAEAYAKELAIGIENSANLNSIEVIDLDEFDLTEGSFESQGQLIYFSQVKYCIFIVSTYGEGDPPDSGVNFAEWLKSTESLPNLNWTIFGLGNRLYIHFNGFSKFIANHFESELSIPPFYPPFYGDEDGNLEDEFDSWKDKLIEDFDFTRVLPVKSNNHHQIDKPKKPILNFKLFYAENRRDLPFDSRVINGGNCQFSKFYFLCDHSRLIDKKIVIEKDDKIVSEMIFDLKNLPHVSYYPGDTVDILPRNHPSCVKFILNFFKFENFRETDYFGFRLKDENYSKPVKKPFPICRVLYCLEWFIDLHFFPSRNFLHDLNEILDSEEFNDWFHRVVSIDDSFHLLKHNLSFCDFISLLSRGDLSWDEKYSSTQRISGLQELNKSSNGSHELNKLFPPILSESILKKFTFEVLIHIGQKNKSRSYTIASSPSTRELRVICSIERGDVFDGICSSWMCLKEENQSLLQVGNICKIHVKANKHFRLNISNLKKPHHFIFIANGTGIAPFVGFLEALVNIKHCIKIDVFYGCRYQNSDDYYINILDQLAKKSHGNIMINFKLAYSRGQGNRQYVQDVVDVNLIKSAICENVESIDIPTVYLCGSLGMGRAIFKKFENSFDLTEYRQKGVIVDEFWG